MPPLLRLRCKFSTLLLYPDYTLIFVLCFHSLEAAAASPDTLSQAAIIDNLDPVEAARLDKVRNIGIAVYTISATFCCSLQRLTTFLR